VWTAVMQLSHLYAIPQIMPQLRQLVVDVSPWRPGFDPFGICGE